MSASADRPVLPRDDPAGAPGTIAYVGIDSRLEGRVLLDALRRAIAIRGGYCSWTVGRPLGHASWVVTLHSPDEQGFYGKTLEEALARCLVWLMAPELGVGPFLV